MRVDPDGDIQVLLQGADQFMGHIRGDEAGHVLDDDGVRPHVRQLSAHVHEALRGVHGGSGVADGAVGLGSGLLGGADGGFHVARIVHAVENAEDVHAVLQEKQLVMDVLMMILVGVSVLEILPIIVVKQAKDMILLKKKL